LSRNAAVSPANPAPTTQRSTSTIPAWSATHCAGDWFCYLQQGYCDTPVGETGRAPRDALRTLLKAAVASAAVVLLSLTLTNLLDPSSKPQN
jgi:hypothetical protein